MKSETNEIKVLRGFIEEFSPFYNMKSTEDFTYDDLIGIVKDIVEEF